jgi:hypothetical protein
MSKARDAYLYTAEELLKTSDNHLQRCIGYGLSGLDIVMSQEAAFSELFELIVKERAHLMGWNLAQSKKFMLDFMSAAFELKSKGTTDLTKQ